MQYCKISSSCSSNWEDGGGSGKDTTDFDSEGSNVSVWSSSESEKAKKGREANVK
jgi:hypothetical protein